MQPAGSIWLVYTRAELRSGKTAFSQEYDSQLTAGISAFSCLNHQESHGRKILSYFLMKTGKVPAGFCVIKEIKCDYFSKLNILEQCFDAISRTHV